MNKREAIRNHRRLWKWLAENPGKDKEDWPRWAIYGGAITNNCFLCELALDKDSVQICPNCIGDWGYYKSCSTNSDGLFSRWEKVSNHKKRTELALKIRDVVKAV